MNSALTALLRDKHTTISIAHRLSTIKRSDLLIVLSPDGKVAEQGTYKDLSSRPDGAFTKLMEWQMSGGNDSDIVDDGKSGETKPQADDITVAVRPGPGPPTQSEVDWMTSETEAEAESEREDDVSGNKRR